MKKMLSIFLVLIMCVLVGIPASADTIYLSPTQATAGDNIPQRSSYITVKDSQVWVVFADGSQYFTPWTYKELVIPSSLYTYTSELKLRRIDYDTYYNNKKADSVSYYSYSYTLIKK